jgi:hypothetical protein
MSGISEKAFSSVDRNELSIVLSTSRGVKSVLRAVEGFVRFGSPGELLILDEGVDEVSMECLLARANEYDWIRVEPASDGGIKVGVLEGLAGRYV